MNKTTTINVLLSFLKLTSQENTAVDVSTVAEHANVPRDVSYEILQRYGLELNNVVPSYRVRVMLEIVKLGYDAERAARYLHWRELEEYVSELTIRYGFKTIKNLRYKLDKRRYEVDIIASSDSYAFIFDCKRWKKRLSGKVLLEIATKQAERAYALGRFISRVTEVEETEVRIIPAVLTIYEPASRIVEGTPIIPIYTLSSFLEEGAYSDELLNIRIKTDNNWFEKLKGKQLRLIS